jgi:hypothetical protein
VETGAVTTAATIAISAPVSSAALRRGVDAGVGDSTRVLSARIGRDLVLERLALSATGGCAV